MKSNLNLTLNQLKSAFSHHLSWRSTCLAIFGDHGYFNDNRCWIV